MNHIGIDLGGTKIEGILVDGDLCTMERKRIRTPRDYTGILSAINGLIDEIGGMNAAIGICTPGTVSAGTGLISNSNTRCLIGRPFQGDMEALLDRKISVENDANCFALAEARMGAAKEHGTVLGIIMGTGVGGGIVLDGVIHRGRTGIAGEWGHHILHRGGNRCYCGSRGCVETYISGPALEKRWHELTGKGAPLPEIVKDLDVPNADAWKDEFLDNFAAGLANVIDILDPDAIVLGGGVSNIGFLYDEGRDRVYERVFSDTVDTPILKNSLGDSAGVFGACMI